MDGSSGQPSGGATVEQRRSKRRQVRDLVDAGRLADAQALVVGPAPGADASIAAITSHAELLVLADRPIDASALLEATASRLTRERDLRLRHTAFWLARTRADHRRIRAGAALDRVLDLPGIATVLDVGSGGGEHARIMAAAGKRVTCVDLGRSVYYERGPATAGEADLEPGSIRTVLADFGRWESDERFDLVWASHVLEHQVNPNLFLTRCLALVADGGRLTVTVPPLKHSIVGGHVTLWNAGLLLYQLVMAGNDCRNAVVMNYGYNISIIVEKAPAELPQLSFDAGDIDLLKDLLPPGCGEGFNGRLLGDPAALARGLVP